MTATTNQPTGRWLGTRGIFCHCVPDVEDIDLKDWDGGLASTRWSPRSQTGHPAFRVN
jgi:hypothetical protein